MRVRNSRINNTMAGLLEKKMTEFEIQANEKPAGDFPEEDSGEFGAKFPGYRWEMKSQPFEMPDMTGALTAKSGGVDQMTLTIVHSMADYIKQAVKEMTVSVYYKGRKGHEVKQSAAMYIIDYTKELPMPGGMPGGGAPGTTGGAPASGGSGPAAGPKGP
jgi:hypothetical protein